jgi:hypothetical protein
MGKKVWVNANKKAGSGETLGFRQKSHHHGLRGLHP